MAEEDLDSASSPSTSTRLDSATASIGSDPSLESEQKNLRHKLGFRRFEPLIESTTWLAVELSRTQEGNADAVNRPRRHEDDNAFNIGVGRWCKYREVRGTVLVCVGFDFGDVNFRLERERH